MQHCTGTSLVADVVDASQASGASEDHGTLFPRADPTQRAARLPYAKGQTTEQRPRPSLNNVPLHPSSHSVGHTERPTLNLKSSWLAEPFMVKDWETLYKGKGTKVDLQCQTPSRQLVATGHQGHPLLPSTLSPRDDLVFALCRCLRDISAPLPKGWAP